MLQSDAGKNAIRACRKPVASMVQGRKRIAEVEERKALLARRHEVVVRRLTGDADNSDNAINSTYQQSTQLRQTIPVQDKAVCSSNDQSHCHDRLHNPGSRMMQSTQMKRVNVRMSERKVASSLASKQDVVRPTAKELKQQAIKQALAEVKHTSSKRHKSKGVKVRFGFKRVLLATACAAIAVFAIVYFVNLSAPDISMKVAAMQSGIESSYPAYVPRDFSLSDITSETGKVALNFKNSNTGDAFTLTEERTSWDSNALLNNFIKEAYGDNYTLIKEQGLAIYISGSNASWVNGGVLYKLVTSSGSLTKKQIKSIAVSL